MPDPELPAEFTPSPWGQIDRGPIDAVVDDDILAGIEREIRRLLGYERVFEPSDG